VSKDKFSKSDCKYEVMGFRCLEEFLLKNTFLFREPEGVQFCSRAYDFTPENWIIGYRFSLCKYVDRITRISIQFAI